MKLLSKISMPNPLFGLLVVFWIILFLTGGGARADIQSLVLLRPLAICTLAFGLWGLAANDVNRFRFLFIMVGGSFALIAVQLLPLPYLIWSNLPGRGLIAETDKITKIGEIWRPLSLLPTNSWNALFAMFIPMSVLVLLSRINQEQRISMLVITLVIGLISAIIGLLQLIGSNEGPLYFYRITNRGAAVGLFANRNHNAIFLACLIPMLAVFASLQSKRFNSQKFRLVAAASTGAFLLLLILVSGSRAGFLLAIIGLVSAPFLYQPIQKERKTKAGSNTGINYKIWLPILVFVGIILLGLLNAKAISFVRLFANDGQNDLRYQVWGPISKMAWAYFPIGSGIGTFAEVYKIYEPSALLSPEYLNHAHNDLLETLMTGGLIAFLLLSAAVCAWTKIAFTLFFRDAKNSLTTLFGKLGTVLIFMLALGSIADYPLRTPSLVSLFILAAVWMAASVKIVPSGRSYKN
jgi:O-antigen ligase